MYVYIYMHIYIYMYIYIHIVLQICECVFARVCVGVRAEAPALRDDAVVVVNLSYPSRISKVSPRTMRRRDFA